MTLAHWVCVGNHRCCGDYDFKANVLIPCIVSTLLIGFLYHGSLASAAQTLFNACMAALGEVGSVFVIIGLMYAMLIP